MTALFESFSLTFIRDLFSLSILTYLWFSQVRKPVLDTDIISDQGKHFISHFWRLLCQLLEIKANLLTAYHPETDGQTEWVNQILEQYLQVYINYQKDDWVKLLPLEEFAYNNTSHSATMVTPLFANKGFHPKLKVSLEPVVLEVAHQVATYLKELHLYLCNQITHTLKIWGPLCVMMPSNPPIQSQGHCLARLAEHPNHSSLEEAWPLLLRTLPDFWEGVIRSVPGSVMYPSCVPCVTAATH